MFHRFATSVIAVYCRFRLSKNEFRKCRDAKPQSSVVTKTIRVEQAFQEHNLTQLFPGSCTPSDPTGCKHSYCRCPGNVTIFVFPIPFSLRVLIMRVYTSICILGWIDVTGHTYSCGGTISKVKRGGESTR